MYILRLVINIILISLVISCSRGNRTDLNSIEGVWVWKKSIEEIRVYTAVNYFDEDRGGIQFLKNGELRVKQNIGWCGTPPVTYETVRGTWNKTSDSTYKLEYPYWGGKITHDILIMKVTNSELQIKSIKLDLGPRVKHRTTSYWRYGGLTSSTICI
jgi:hypothetical protein